MTMKTRMSILTAAPLMQWLCIGFCFAADHMVPLKTDMATINPKMPVYDCAPFQTKVKPCEPELLEEPVIQVPENTINMSKNRPVISSDPNPVIGDLEMVTDGQKKLVEDGYVELKEGLQWLQIDLGPECDINVIWVWHYFDVQQKTCKIAFRDVVVQVSNNEKFDDAVSTVFNNDTDNSAKLGKGNDKAYIETRFGKPIVLGKPTKGRYVRLYSNGNDRQEANSYVEVEVFGSLSEPAKE
jgi:hypothetical protein